MQREERAVAFTFGTYFKQMVAGSWDYLNFVTPQFVPRQACRDYPVSAHGPLLK